jgi:hypothetical protein
MSKISAFRVHEANFLQVKTAPPRNLGKPLNKQINYYFPIKGTAVCRSLWSFQSLSRSEAFAFNRRSHEIHPAIEFRF